jgi:hypothetical protein
MINKTGVAGLLALAVLVGLSPAIPVAAAESTTTPTLVAEWNHQFGKIWWRMVLGPSPAVADLGYGTQDLEIITGNDEYYPIPGLSGRWFAFDARGNVLWTLDTGNDESRSSVAIVDVDQDGDLEIVGGTTSGWHVQMFDPAGKMIWSRPVWYYVHSSPAVADLRADDQGLEIVAGTYTGKVVCFDVQGNLLWSYLTGNLKYCWWWYTGFVISSPAIGDLDADGTLEVVVSSSNANWYGWWSYERWWADIEPTLHVLNGETGAAKWTHEFTGAYGAVSSAALANLDQDQALEIVVGSGDGKIYCFDGATGILEWTFATSGGVYSSPAVGDLDGDGSPDIVIGSNDGSVYALDAQGQLKWSYATGGAVWSSPALANRGTGGLEVYVGSEDGYLYLLEGSSGALIHRFSTGEPIRSSPVVADIDGDQKLEILFISWARKYSSSWYWIYSDFRVSGDDLWCLEDAGSEVTQYAVEWGMFRRDERRTGLYPLPSSPEPEPVQLETTIHIAPRTLNFKSRGKWITAYIELTSGWNVEDIDLASIRLNGTLETTGPSEVGDHDEDGVPDLMVKFDRQALIRMLRGTVATPGEVELRITGEIMLEPDAFPFEVSTFSFEASENIRVIDPGQGKGGGQGNGPG